MKIRTIITRRKRALKTAKPAERERLRREYKIALVCQILKGRAA